MVFDIGGGGSLKFRPWGMGCLKKNLTRGVGGGRGVSINRYCHYFHMQAKLLSRSKHLVVVVFHKADSGIRCTLVHDDCTTYNRYHFPSHSRLCLFKLMTWCLLTRYDIFIVFMFIYLFVCLLPCRFIFCLFICLFVRLFVCLFVNLFVCLSVRPYLSTYLPSYIPTYLLTYLHTFLLFVESIVVFSFHTLVNL